MNILMFGPPASGKGTQATLLAHRFGFKHLTTGEILRERAKTDSEMDAILKRGALISDDILIQIVSEYIAASSGDGIIFDGFPRTIAQAIALDNLLDHKSSVFINLQVGDEVLTERMLARSIKDCRADDNIEAFTHRLGVYRAQTAPVLDHYKDFMVHLDGEQSVENISEAIFGAMLSSVED